MKVKRNSCEICGAEGQFDSGVLINFGDGGAADIEACADCADKIFKMIMPHVYICPVCSDTFRTAKKAGSFATAWRHRFTVSLHKKIKTEGNTE